jgi:hypothetical protein
MAKEPEVKISSRLAFHKIRRNLNFKIRFGESLKE